MRTAVEETNIGIGKVRVLDLGQIDETVNISIQNGFEAERAGGSLKPTCFFTLGYLEGSSRSCSGKTRRARKRVAGPVVRISAGSR